jgi:hypothetical protein
VEYRIRSLAKELATASRSVHLVRASSFKHQAHKVSSFKRQASSPKHKGSSFKPQAASSWTMDPGKSFMVLGPRDSTQEGSELCNPKLSPLVVKYIGQLKEERLRKHEVTYEGHVAELARLREAALKKGSFSSAVNAEANRGKAAGLYIDRKIIKTGKLEDLSEQELEAKMKQILDDYAQIIDVTPEPEKIEDQSASSESY